MTLKRWGAKPSQAGVAEAAGSSAVLAATAANRVTAQAPIVPFCSPQEGGTAQLPGIIETEPGTWIPLEKCTAEQIQAEAYRLANEAEGLVAEARNLMRYNQIKGGAR